MEDDDFPRASASTPNARYQSPPSSPTILPGTRTSSRGFQNASSPPVTPPSNRNRRSKGKGKQQHRPRLDRDWTDEIDAHQPDGRGSAATAIPARHSHGLSWNSTTRDSVVDNLLFSLDNLSRQDISGMEGPRDDEEKQRYLSSLSSQFEPSSSSRGHAHSSSTSDYDRQMPHSPQSTTKGRRSNSSSTISNNLAGRMARANAMGRSSSSSDNRPKYVTGHSFVARKQSSEAGSVDYGYSTVLESNRLGLSAGRSVSMDRIQSDTADGPSVLDRGRPVPSVHSKYDANEDADAAPEPIIAAGPRKMQNPTATGPVFVGAQPKTKPAALRKTTTQQDLRSAAHSPSQPIPQDIRDQAADFVRTSSMRGNLSPPSAQTMNSAPSPGIAPRRRDPSPPRERPGFFKRVFGSSSRTVSSPVERPSSNQTRQDPNEQPSATQSRSISQTSAGTQPKTESKTTAMTATPLPPTLNKKPSSFFRRRKKSTSEIIPPTPLPVNTNLNVKAAEPSPSISSLRKVMDPFLTTDANAPPVPRQDPSRPPTASSKTEDSEDPDIFHSGYTPPPDASLGARHPVSREHSRRPTPEPEESPSQKMKVKKRRPEILINSNAQALGHQTYLQEPGRQTSTVSIHDDFNDPPKVSPLSDVTPNISRPKTPGSRPSTGERIISKENSPIESPPGEDMRDFSAGTGLTFDMNDDGWVVTKHAPLERPQSKKSARLRLQPTASEEQMNAATDESPGDKVIPPPVVQVQPNHNELPMRSQSAMGLSLPTLQIERSVSRNSSEPTIIPVQPEMIDEGAEYRERARRIFEGDEEDVVKGDAAAWLGERNTLSTRTLQAYMQLFDFSGLNILGALRVLCTKLVLRGETQQFDRIITAISARWCACNPNHGFKAQDVVHTIIYSLILLNTDLHLADIGEKMSRSAYVKNTLPTIKRVVADAAPNAFDDTLRPGTLSRPILPWSDSSPSLQTSSLPPTSPAAVPASLPSSPRPDVDVPSSLYTAEQLNSAGAGVKRMSIRPGMMRNDSDIVTPDSAQSGTSNALVERTWTGSMRGWEVEIEAILKSFYTSIRAEPLPLHGAMAGDLPSGNRNLSVVDLNGALKRSGSVVSRTPSDNMSFRSKQDFRSMTMRWQSRSNRSRPRLYPASTAGSSRTSFDDGSGFWSPAQSSKYSFSKTLTSASVGSFNHHFPSIDSFKHSIGFANALSQAIIREETAGGDTDSFSMLDGLLEDETLALQGAPWAKEGMVKHKHHMETTDRKAKDRNWTECFAVISKGKLTLFDFNKTSKSQSIGRKGPFNKPGKAASVAAKQVGGGDWMENAEQLDTFILRQTIASTLPTPGYSKARPHVWALSLPSGAVHLFHVGTPEIAVEFMTTANYWSARLSKEPLAGGVSNIEYGWSDQIINPALLNRSESFQHPPSSMQSRQMGHAHSMSTERGQRSSLQSSIRGSIDTGFGGSIRAKLPGDKTTIHEWQPPSQSMMASQLMEVDQLRQLTTYVQTQEEELERHNELKHAIELAYSPRHPNFNKSLANWQRKSDYLLREIVKFRTYIDSLVAAQKAKETYYVKKAEGRLSPVAKRDDDDVNELPAIGGMMGDVTPRGIHTSG